ncbi:nuclear transport factor 2 family protein [Lolliginicoccus suaedae]|uniref:nuclear transport factor 2 family protein n=1 Tax=Lolliginicoccus suaedae TaxID=2605429 RepID=UPI0011ECC518|nr:nuclear transport factor 2 family protein [Lolliginicoccus suaedae]
MTSKLPAAVQQLIAATNSGDVEGFLGSFSDDGVVDDWGREFHGRQAIKEWSDREYIGKQITLDVTHSAVAGDSATVTTIVGGNGYNGPSTFIFDISGAQVSRMTIRE